MDEKLSEFIEVIGQIRGVAGDNIGFLRQALKNTTGEERLGIQQEIARHQAGVAAMKRATQLARQCARQKPGKERATALGELEFLEDAIYAYIERNTEDEAEVDSLIDAGDENAEMLLIERGLLQEVLNELDNKIASSLPASQIERAQMRVNTLIRELRDLSNDE